MTHFGLICFPSTGHLNPMTTLGYELQKRAHQVTLFGIVDTKPKTLAAGLEFRGIAKLEFPTGALRQCYTKLGQMSGLAALRYTINLLREFSAVVLRDAPGAIREAQIDVLLVDQASPEGGTIAELLSIPFISVCNAIVLNREYGVPPHWTHWDYHPTCWAHWRNRAAYQLFDLLGLPVIKLIAQYRREWNLPSHTSPGEYFSKLAQLSQQPAEFEFPRQYLPECFHFTGPYHSRASREPVAFPEQKLTGQPLIYASMGTLQNRLIEVFDKIASACVGLDAQLVISLGGSVNPDSVSQLPGSPLVVNYAPQLELLQKATLTITHAGLNTTLESLSNGVPMVAIPIANDQPGIAARIAWTGVGEVLPLAQLSVPRLQTKIKQVLSGDSYHKNAIRLQEAIGRAGGVTRAADIIEQVVSTGKLVLSQTNLQQFSSQ
ncbi:MAG: glycosyltransferase [Symploca sp. SIO2E9]|nr:glycosyltransferase [Symploca sp. SIO2E9]